jgi:5-formyltetrahydrofolate cyclo-ligase
VISGRYGQDARRHGGPTSETSLAGDSAVAGAKAVLRASLAGVAAGLGPDGARAIAERLADVVASRPVRGVVGYVALRDEIELQWLWRRLGESAVPVFYPRTDADGVPRVVAPARDDPWERGPHGVRQPAAGRVLEGAGEGIVACIPGLAFDADGRRLGRGAGWYDRLLAAHGAALRVGVAPDARIVPAVPCDAWDVCMNLIVTETRTIRPVDSRGDVREETNS